MGKKYYLKTFGCQMNLADSERMQALLHSEGMVETSTVEEANVILINGCSVREKAVHKAVSQLGILFAQAKNCLPGEAFRPVFGIGGCVGQLEQDSLFRQFPLLDFVFGPDAIDSLPLMIENAVSGKKRQMYVDFDPENGFETETILSEKKAQAFVNIMKGCDKFCTYCIVPFTRGREKSRRITEVLEDLARLVGNGVREVTLLGQNVNSFGKGNLSETERFPQELHSPLGKVGPRRGEENFPQLLRAIESDPRLTRLKRIRFTSSHPLDFSDELLDCYGDLKKLARQLHLPVQSGSNEVLKRMGRHHKIETYIEQMDRLRKIAPDVGLSTDLIVGFPGETEEEYQETLRLLERVRFDNVYAFSYSVRPGTRAEKLANDVPEEVKKRRLNGLFERQLSLSKDLFQSFIGKEMEVLVEGTAKNQILKRSLGALKEGKVWTGRTSCGKVTNFSHAGNRDLTGALLPIRILGGSALALRGEMVVDPRFAEEVEAKEMEAS